MSESVHKSTSDTKNAVETAESIPLMLSINSYENYEGVIPGKTKKVLCLKHPPPWLSKAAKHITLERIKIGIILFFVLKKYIKSKYNTTRPLMPPVYRTNKTLQQKNIL